MKLHQFHIDEHQLAIAPKIVEFLLSLFHDVEHRDFQVFPIMSQDQPNYILAKSDDIGHISERALIDSFKKKRKPESAYAIRSLTSCHFIVFEDDGVVRLCYSSRDKFPSFHGIVIRHEDASDLITKTDLFDFF